MGSCHGGTAHEFIAAAAVCRVDVLAGSHDFRLHLKVCSGAPAGGLCRCECHICRASDDFAGEAVAEFETFGKKITIRTAHKTKGNGTGEGKVKHTGSVVVEDDTCCACGCCICDLIAKSYGAAFNEGNLALNIDLIKFFGAAETAIQEIIHRPHIAVQGGTVLAHAIKQASVAEHYVRSYVVFGDVIRRFPDPADNLFGRYLSVTVFVAVQFDKRPGQLIASSELGGYGTNGSFEHVYVFFRI